ncbi:MAG TPA: SLC13 family permease [Dokdonella sp.]|nr:SLC13 family permease [Dokdonella sp.]
MNGQQLIIIGVLLLTVALFLWGRWRHDLVAMAALLASVMAGAVPVRDAFSGFGHPAVITVACVLILGHGLQATGAVQVLAKHLLPSRGGPTLGILALVTLAALLSGFMNNVGALAMLMPVAIQMAARHELPAGKILMPLAFGSILGGMTTLIGTPPNLIVADYRTTTGMGPFAMFDFAPVGVAVAAVGLLFVALVGWRMVPTRKQATTGSFDTGAYLSEVRVTEGSKAVDRSVREVEQILDAADAQIIALVRGDMRLSAPSPRRTLRSGDILVIEVEPDSLSRVLSSLGLKLEEDVPSTGNTPEVADADAAAASGEAAPATLDEAARQAGSQDKSRPGEVVVQEFVVGPYSELVQRSATDAQLRTRFGISLLAISRQGQRSIRRLRATRILAGDVLLMQGTSEALAGFASQFGCLPLAARDIRVPKKGQALNATVVMGLAVAATSLGLLPAAIAFAAAALIFVLLALVPLRSAYGAIDWPVIVLLGAMIPVADAMGSTGAADLVAQFLLDHVSQGHVIASLAILLVVTMFLSDLMNNAATAAVMCPIAISSAGQLGVSADAFLMAVAIGSSCAFLTPIGHQNNTLILGPGGFHFGDYWRLGLAVEVLVVAVGPPLILLGWAP